MVRRIAVRTFLRASVLAVLLVVPLEAQVVVPEILKPENRTPSNSRQFTVFGGTAGQRSALARRGDELKSALDRELQGSEAWKTPILIILNPGDGMRVRQSPVFVQVFDGEEAGAKIQIDVAPGAVDDSAAIDRGILRALLLERSLREQKFEGGRFIEPPEWLSAAMAAALGREAKRDASLYAALLEAKAMPRLDRFLRQNGTTLRGRARELYAAQSLALYNSLLELPDGRGKILANLTLASPARDPLQRFAQTWPDLANDPPKLARQWALAVARLSTPKKLEFLGSEETGKKLTQILRGLDASADGEASPEILLALSRKEEGRFRLAQAARETQMLAFRSHPLYAPLVDEYHVMLDNLARNRRRGFETRFTEAEDLRAALDDRTGEITDFMNWYQANDPQAPLLPETLTLTAPPAKAARRNDAISRYLDSVEQRGW